MTPRSRSTRLQRNANISPSRWNATPEENAARYVHKLFEGEGTTLSKFILGLRLQRVHGMLSDPRHADLTIGAIAYKVGFGDLSTFNREFRRRYGATPKEVRAAGS
jgi:AraC-like DNA-binding protein